MLRGRLQLSFCFCLNKYQTSLFTDKISLSNIVFSMMDISTLRHCGTPVAVKTACRRTHFPRHQTRAILRQHSPRPVAQPINPPFLRESEHLTAWTPESWQQFQAHQQPNYTDVQKVTDALETISRLPALVFAGECRNLQSRLAKCATGEAFLVQGVRSQLFAHAVDILLVFMTMRGQALVILPVHRQYDAVSGLFSACPMLASHIMAVQIWRRCSEP